MQKSNSRMKSYQLSLEQHQVSTVTTNQTRNLVTNADSKNMSNYNVTIMPNLMATLSNIGGALCSTPQSLADTHY